MKKIALIICCCSIAMNGTTQQRKLDSLMRLLESHPKEDNTRCEILADLSFCYVHTDPEKGLKAADDALLLALKLQNKKLEAKAYGCKGHNYKQLNKDSVAEKMYEKCIQIYNQLNDKRTSVGAILGLTDIYFNRGELHRALQSLNHCEKMLARDDDYLTETYNQIGGIHHSLSNYTLGIEYYLKALQLAERKNLTNSAATIQSNIGVVYQDIGNYAKALEYHIKALNIHKHEQSKRGIAWELENIAIAYDNMQNQSLALQYFEDALQINREIKSKRGEATTLANMGSLYYYSFKYKEALSSLLEAAKILEEQDDKYSLSTTLALIGAVYTNAPDMVLRPYCNIRDRYITANSYNNKALHLAKEVGSLTKEEEVLQSMITVYEKQKDYSKALAVYKQVLPLHDSISNNKKKDEFTRQELNYQFSKKEALAAAEMQREQTIKKAAIIAGISLFIASIVSFVFYKRRRDAESLKKATAFKLEVSDVEMKALRAQMNPHFIFNSLHAINTYMMDNDKENASEYLAKFSKLMRLILANSREQEVVLEKDLAALKLYIQLELLRFKDKFKYSIEIDPEIDVENTLIPPMLLQPFVENSILHGIAEKNDGLVRIKISKEGDHIICIVEDNGKGRPQAVVIEPERKKPESLGMKITQERLKILNQIKKIKTAINIFDLRDANNMPSGLRIELSLPYEQAY